MKYLLYEVNLIWANEILCSYENGTYKYTIFSLKRIYIQSLKIIAHMCYLLGCTTWSEKSKVIKQCEWFDYFNFFFFKRKFYLYILAIMHNFPSPINPRKKSAIRRHGIEVGKGDFILHFVSFCTI